MRVLLVTPSFEDKHRGPGIYVNSHYPLGLASIRASLDKAGHETYLLFVNNLPPVHCMANVTHLLVMWKPDAVCIQMMTHNKTMGLLIAEYITKTHPNVKIFLGGIHATVMADQVSKKIPEAVVIRGEGELSLVKALREGWKPGIYEGEEILNLDNLPMVDHRKFKNPQRTMYALLTSRGCPFKCSFCVLDSISHRKVRYKSVERVVAEIEEISKIDGCKSIWIHDDNFVMDNKRAIKIAEEVMKKDIKLLYACSARVKPVTPELLDALESMGVRNMMFGFESCADSVLKRTHKGITTEDIANTVRMFKGRKLPPIGFLMVGLPGETRQTIKETGRFINELQKEVYLRYEDIGITMVYPGTEVYEIAKAAGDITDDYWLTDKPVPFFTTEHTEGGLEELKAELLRMIVK